MVPAGYVFISALFLSAAAHHEQWGLGDEWADIDEALHSYKPDSESLFERLYPTWVPQPADIRDSGPPLVLNGKAPEEVKKLARVTGPLGSVEGYSGFLTVRNEHNTSFFFWYFPSEIKGTENLPALLDVMCTCHEFADVQLRMNERVQLNSLNQNKERETIRYPMEGRIKTREMKVNWGWLAQLETLDYRDKPSVTFSCSFGRNTTLSLAVPVNSLPKGVENAPLVLWLQGGPGATSLFGLFTEIGPYEVVGSELKERKHSWHRHYNLLFVDNPVGTGYSFTDHDDGLCKNQGQIARQLYQGLQEFLHVFPEVRKQPLIITGESYAGKHIPSLAAEIHHHRHSDKPKINLKGIAIGNPFIEPQENVGFSEIASTLGLVDSPTARTMRRLEAVVPRLMKKKMTREAYTVLNTNLQLLATNSNYTNVYNLLRPHEQALEADFIEYVQTPQSRVSLHVGDLPFQSLGRVYQELIPDFMNSGMEYLKTLKGEYPILLYSGHMDIIVSYPFTRRVVESLSGPCPHRAWFLDGRLAGYKHKCDDIELAVVHTAGHMVPTDQPEAAIDLIGDFINRATKKS